MINHLDRARAHLAQAANSLFSAHEALRLAADVIDEQTPPDLSESGPWETLAAIPSHISAVYDADDYKLERTDYGWDYVENSYGGTTVVDITICRPASPFRLDR